MKCEETLKNIRYVSDLVPHMEITQFGFLFERKKIGTGPFRQPQKRQWWVKEFRFGSHVPDV